MGSRSIEKGPASVTAQSPSGELCWPFQCCAVLRCAGGSVTAGMGIYDAMMLCRADVQTYCFGLAASMGAFLLGAGGFVALTLASTAHAHSCSTPLAAAAHLQVNRPLRCTCA